jgi:hypothetical protein
MLPEVLIGRLAGERTAPSIAVPICTTDDEGFPHPAMLSYAELRSDGGRGLRAAIWGASRTARYLRDRRRLTLFFVDESVTCYVKARVDGAESPHPSAPGVAVFPLAIESVSLDRVDTAREPDAVIESGITFRRAVAGTTL